MEGGTEALHDEVGVHFMEIWDFEVAERIFIHFAKSNFRFMNMNVKL